jgi:hypothetical protein
VNPFIELRTPVGKGSQAREVLGTLSPARGGMRGSDLSSDAPVIFSRSIRDTTSPRDGNVRMIRKQSIPRPRRTNAGRALCRFVCCPSGRVMRLAGCVRRAPWVGGRI